MINGRTTPLSSFAGASEVRYADHLSAHTHSLARPPQPTDCAVAGPSPKAAAAAAAAADVEESNGVEDTPAAAACKAAALAKPVPGAAYTLPVFEAAELVAAVWCP